MSKENEKPADMSKTITLTEKSLQDMVTMAAMASAQAIANHLKPPAANEEQIAAKVVQDQQCNDCGQVRKACRGKHRKAVVFPRNPMRERWFQGVFINGICYRSDFAGQPITVPADCNIEYMMDKWEENEEALITGRVKQHNSGVIGGAGRSGFRAAQGGWR